jgi:hypothetical protein
LVDKDGDSFECPTAGLDQPTRRGGLAAPFDPVIDEQYSITGSNRRPLNLQNVALSPVVRSRLDPMFRSGKQAALLAYRDEANSERIRGGSTEDESSGLDSADLRDRVVPPRRDERRDHFAERRTVAEDAPDIRVSILPTEATKKGFGATCVSSTHDD